MDLGLFQKLLNPLVEMQKCMIRVLDGGLLIDATLGGGGHCSLLLEAHPNLRAIGLDQDPSAYQLFFGDSEDEL